MVVTVLHDGYQTSISHKQSAVGHFTDAWSNQDLGSLEARSFGFYVARFIASAAWGPVPYNEMYRPVLCYVNCYIETQQWMVHWFKFSFHSLSLSETNVQRKTFRKFGELLLKTTLIISVKFLSLEAKYK